MDMKEKGMQKKLFIAIAAVAVAIVALALILALGRKDETYRSIKIIELKGSVTIEREGVGTLEASSNMNLISGDAVKTEQDAYAVLQLDSDKYVMLAESGSMTVVAEGDEANGRTAIQLDSGSVLNEIQNPLSSGSSYDIVTPNATMSVRGTVFEVRKNGDGNTGDIEVLVYDGKVAVGLDGMEPALYEAGEYTQFTADQNPQFIVERAEITEEHLNPQFMERLEQINSQSRELNLGTAQLASAQTQGEVSEPQQTPAVSAPVATPAQTAPPAAPTPSVAPATSAPSTTPAETLQPVKTPAPQAEAVQEPSAAAPEASPAVEDPEPDDDEEDDQPDQPDQPVQPVQPTQKPGGDHNDGNTGDNSGDTGNNSGNAGDNSGNTGNNSGNTENNSSYQDFWRTYTIAEYRQNVSDYDYQQSVSDGNAATKKCTVVFYLPYVVKAVDTGDGSSESIMQNDAPVVYCNMQVQAGECIEAPRPPYAKVNYSETLLSFVDWCLEDGTIWDFSEPVKADMCLYPIWKDNASRYFPVICRSVEDWGHYCYCNNVKENSSLKGVTLNDDAGHVFQGWERAKAENAVWNPKTETLIITGSESLKASWSD